MFYKITNGQFHKEKSCGKKEKGLDRLL